MHRLYVRKIRLNRILSLDLIIVYQFTYFIICLTIMNTSRRCSLDILTHVFRRMIFHFVHSRALSWDKKQRYVTFYFAQNSVSKLHFLDLHFPRYPIPYNFFWEFWLGTCLRTQWYYALRIHCDIFLSIYAYNTLLRISKYFNYFFSSCMWQFD